jgi:hypothetical protein
MCNHVSVWQASLLPLVHIEAIVCAHIRVGRAKVSGEQICVHLLPDGFEDAWNGVN